MVRIVVEQNRQSHIGSTDVKAPGAICSRNQLPISIHRPKTAAWPTRLFFAVVVVDVPAARVSVNRGPAVATMDRCSPARMADSSARSVTAGRTARSHP